MHKLLTSVTLLTFALAMSGCKTAGEAVSPRVQLPPVPPSLMQPPETEKKVRRELFEPPAKPTTGSSDSKRSSEQIAQCKLESDLMGRPTDACDSLENTMEQIGRDLADLQRTLTGE